MMIYPCVDAVQLGAIWGGGGKDVVEISWFYSWSSLCPHAYLAHITFQRIEGIWGKIL